MDPLSCQESLNDQHDEILPGTEPTSNHEQRSSKNLTPQILAAFLASLYHIAFGMSRVYELVFISQWWKNPEFVHSDKAEMWTDNADFLIISGGSIVVGVLMDYFGRVRTLTWAVIPGVIGWVLMALAQDAKMLIAARVLTRFFSTLGTFPAFVYVSEIARDDLRGSLLSMPQALAHLGTVLTCVMGYFLTWRQIAWVITVFVVLPCVPVFLIPESPAWLVSRGRMDHARKSLTWMNKYKPQIQDQTQTYPELQIALLENNHRSRRSTKVKLYEFIKPTFYKPLIILTGLFFLQQIPHVFWAANVALSFSQQGGRENYNHVYVPYIYMFSVFFVMSVIGLYLQKKYGRRPLLLISCLGIVLCMVLLGILKCWNNASDVTWVEFVFHSLGMVMALVGVIPIPFFMTTELFPLEIRGIAHTISYCLTIFFTFCSLQLRIYNFFLIHNCDKIFFLAFVVSVCAIYVYFFVPETQGKTIAEIEGYFRENTVYVGKKEIAGRLAHIQRIMSRKQQNEEHSFGQI